MLRDFTSFPSFQIFHLYYLNLNIRILEFSIFNLQNSSSIQNIQLQNSNPIISDSKNLFEYSDSDSNIRVPRFNIQIFEYPNSNSIIRVFRFRIFRNIRVSRFNIQIFEYPDSIFKYSSIQIQNIQKYSSIQIQIRIFEYSDSEYSEIFEYQDIQIFKYSNIRVPRFKFEYSSIQIDIWISKIRIPRSCYAIIVIFDIEVSNSCRLIKFLLIQNSPRSKFNTRPLYYVRRRVYTGMRGVAASRRTNRWFLESH